MKMINQRILSDLELSNISKDTINIKQYDVNDDYQEITIDKRGAKQLIEILKEFVDEK